jgi:hypothetical protein
MTIMTEFSAAARRLKTKLIYRLQVVPRSLNQFIKQTLGGYNRKCYLLAFNFKSYGKEAIFG